MAEFVHVYNDGGGIRNVPMREGATRLTTDRVLYQSGIPFWIPPGDGGSNGLIFTGTRGVFTLSTASPLAGLGNTILAGCYAYLPAGSGGLVTGGWFWCVMTDDVNGEIFSDQYSGYGIPTYVTNPTPQSDLTATRITQLTSEITAVSFKMPGKCMGPSGMLILKEKCLTVSSASNKYIRVRIGGTPILNFNTTSSFNNQQFTYSRCNMGVNNKQIGPRTGSATATNWDCHAATSSYSNDITTIDTSVDQDVTFTIELAAVGASAIIIPMQFLVQYGA